MGPATNSASIRSSEPPPVGDGLAFRRRAPRQRPPRPLDWLLFFAGIPILLAVLFSMVGTRLTYGMPYLDALGYMTLHMFVAWWTVNAGAALIKYCFRSWQPPSIVVCLIGLCIALLPAAFLFQALGDVYGRLYPVFAANRFDAIVPAWSLEYLLHFIRYSMPILPTFLAGVYGYRFATGVNWYGYPDDDAAGQAESIPAQQKAHVPVDQPGTRQATANLIAGTKLSAHARLIAIKAEQHYIKIWSDQGTDLVRYRFSDLADTLADCSGIQVHRSWWVNPDDVQTCRQAGRKLELIIDGDLKIPVSLSYKNAVLAALQKR